MTPDGKQVYKDMRTPVLSPLQSSRLKPVLVPAIFAALSGLVNQRKIQVANKAIVDWQLRLKKARVGKQKCPFYQPSTQCVEYRSFLGRMKKHHDWGFNEGHFSGFPGSVKSVLDDIFQKREKVWVSFGFYFITYLYCQCNAFSSNNVFLL